VSIRSRLILAAILAVALAGSVTGLDWGLPYQWHTDEKVTQARNVLRSPGWDPDYFINPHLHIYLVAAAFKVAYALEPGYEVGQTLPDIFPMLDAGSPARRLQFLTMRLARGVSVLLALVTIVIVYRVGRRHWDEDTGLVAAACLAVTMGFINLAHFATPETLLLLLVVAVLASLDRVMERGRLRDYAVAGALTGLACSTKYTAFALAAPFAAAHVVARGPRVSIAPRSLGNLAVAAAAALAAFAATTPYAVIRYRDFGQAIVDAWLMGAPAGSLVGLRRSYGPYLALLGDGLGWPLFVLSLAGVVSGVVAWVRGDRQSSSARGSLIHVVWIVSFYAFYGLSPHHALRFIMPIAPSLVLLAAAASVAFVRRQRQPFAQRLALAGVTAVLIYSGAYTGRADWMFLEDTRYAAGQWLIRTFGQSARIDYFEIEAYLPYFDPAPEHLQYVPFIEHVTLHQSDFWHTARAYLRESSAPIVDSSFYYDRYLDNPRGFPERAEFYRHLLTGTDPAGVKPIARFTLENPRWLNPRPERIAPEVVIFGKPGGK